MYIHHIGVYVANLDAARLFFEKYFGFRSSELYRNPKKGFSSYLLSHERGGCRLELMHRDDTQTEKLDNRFLTPGIHHFNIVVGTQDDVDRIANILAFDGYEVIDGPRLTGDGYYEACIKAVDGLLVEISAE